MSRAGDAVTFVGSMAAVGVSALVMRVVCPGGCAGCGTCAAGVVPVVGVTLAAGSAWAGAALSRRSAGGAQAQPGGSDA